MRIVKRIQTEKIHASKHRRKKRRKVHRSQAEEEQERAEEQAERAAVVTVLESRRRAAADTQTPAQCRTQRCGTWGAGAVLLAAVGQGTGARSCVPRHCPPSRDWAREPARGSGQR